MNYKTKFALLAILLIIGGFSILHSGKVFLENMGSIFIGLGALYLIGLLIWAGRKQK